jgi:hypothetical protein
MKIAEKILFDTKEKSGKIYISFKTTIACPQN